MVIFQDIDLANENVVKFYYDPQNKKIELFLSGYYSILNSQHVEKPCTLIIENWRWTAKARYYGEDRYKDLDKRIGIPGVLYSIGKETDKDGDILTTVFIETLDERHVELLFENAIVRVEFP